jgi:phosphatidylglycerol:prolipoprotein diacylglycerol transferase
VGLTSLRLYRVPLVRGLAAASPALAIGHAIGRVGCFMVGDDYGAKSTLPWAVAFPQGLPPTDAPVHPTQLYEAIPLALLAWLLLRWRRQGVPDYLVLARYLMLAGSLRFAIEFVRINDKVLGPLTVAHLWSLALVIAGVVLMSRRRADASPRKR